MPKARKKPQVTRWERVRLAAGAIGAVVGVIAAVAGLPGKLEEAFGGTNTEQKQLELTEKRAALREAAPRIEASYLFLEERIATGGFSGPPSATEAITLTSFPVVRTEALNRRGATAARCKRGRATIESIAFLVVENRGNRDAVDVTVQLTRLALATPVLIREAPAGGDDYVGKLRAAARAAVQITIEVPRPIAPGAGVRVPIWWSASDSWDSNPWCVFSRVALLPVRVRSHDPVLDVTTTFGVRRLRAPQILADGVETRG